MGERTTEVVKAIKDHIENTCKNVLQHPFFSQQQPDRSTWLTRNGFKCPETKEGTTLGQNYQKIQVIAQNWVKFIQIECSKQVKHKGKKKKRHHRRIVASHMCSAFVRNQRCGSHHH